MFAVKSVKLEIMVSVPQNHGASSSFLSCHFASAPYSPAQSVQQHLAIVVKRNWTIKYGKISFTVFHNLTERPTYCH